MPLGNKKLQMWLAIGGVMLVIFLVWASSIKYSIKASIVDFTSAKEEGMDKLSEAKNNFKEEITQLKEALAQQKSTSTSEVATSTNE